MMSPAIMVTIATYYSCSSNIYITSINLFRILDSTVYENKTIDLNY